MLIVNSIVYRKHFQLLAFQKNVRNAKTSFYQLSVCFRAAT